MYVVYFSSGLAHFAMPGTAAYCITKAALYMLYNVINTEYDAKTVIAGSLKPGIIDTPMQELLRNSDIEKLPSKNLFEDFHTQGQLRSPSEVAVFIAKVLLTTSDDEFKSKEWDIDVGFE